MKRLLLSFLAICTLVGPANALNTKVPTNLHAKDYVCRTLELDCRGIPAPTIIYTGLMSALGLHGAYMPGDRFIFIDPSAPAHTVVHEMTHYILWETGVVEDRCLSEEVARRVHHVYEGTTYDDSWRKRYQCE